MTDRPNDIADEIVAQKLADSDYPLSADMHDDALVEALLGVGVRPRGWKGHPLYARDRAIEIRATTQQRDQHGQRAAVAGLSAVTAALMPLPAEALPLAEWLHQPALDAAGGLMALLAVGIIGVALRLMDMRAGAVDPVNDNRPSLEARAREWEGQQ